MISDLSTVRIVQMKRERWLQKILQEAQAALTAEQWDKLVKGISNAEREAFILWGSKFPALETLDSLSMGRKMGRSPDAPASR